ncbi:MAG: hypothetical protein GX780_03290 [Campylobacteraceae bacterium]|nr:hypothetical protein [Campylobacteraceae bacterium]
MSNKMGIQQKLTNFEGDMKTMVAKTNKDKDENIKKVLFERACNAQLLVENGLVIIKPFEPIKCEFEISKEEQKFVRFLL